MIIYNYFNIKIVISVIVLLNSYEFKMGSKEEERIDTWNRLEKLTNEIDPSKKEERIDLLNKLKEEIDSSKEEERIEKLKNLIALIAYDCFRDMNEKTDECNEKIRVIRDEDFNG